MSVRQVDKKHATKDGRRWCFDTFITDSNGNKKRYHSKNYMTKQEAIQAERELIVNAGKKEVNITDITFKDLYEEFYEYKKDKVKTTTLRTYRVNVLPLEQFFNLKIRDFRYSCTEIFRFSVGFA